MTWEATLHNVFTIQKFVVRKIFYNLKELFSIVILFFNWIY